MYAGRDAGSIQDVERIIPLRVHRADYDQIGRRERPRRETWNTWWSISQAASRPETAPPASPGAAG
jgi:hypothetical protein